MGLGRGSVFGVLAPAEVFTAPGSMERDNVLSLLQRSLFNGDRRSKMRRKATIRTAKGVVILAAVPFLIHAYEYGSDAVNLNTLGV